MKEERLVEIRKGFPFRKKAERSNYYNSEQNYDI